MVVLERGLDLVQPKKKHHFLGSDLQSAQQIHFVPQRGALNRGLSGMLLPTMNARQAAMRKSATEAGKLLKADRQRD